ncbi:hypothetical protein A2U01_0047228 [Trifolium medium]|uniref:Uncharacterized protein n=1 Tax=Trifolium medium TaxID=97028 RepID=A0A392QPY3_9FABA|nr:hypothetical protein [Trifolium medium]
MKQEHIYSRARALRRDCRALRSQQKQKLLQHSTGALRHEPGAPCAINSNNTRFSSSSIFQGKSQQEPM